MNKPERDGFVTDELVNTEAPAAAMEAAAPAAPEPYKETWPVRVKLLHGKVQNNVGHEVEELSFRAPTGGDINRYGNPVRLDNNLEPVIDEKKMTLMMAVLAGINMPNLERMDARDWSSCAMRLRIFFTPSAEGWL